MVLQFKENFVVWDNITKYGSNQGEIIQDSNPLRIAWTSGPNEGGIKTSALPGVFTPATNKITMYFRVQHGDAGRGASGDFTAYVYDGTTYLGFGGKAATAGNDRHMVITKDTVDPHTLFKQTTNDPTAQDVIHWHWPAPDPTRWNWFKMEVEGTDVKVYYIPGTAGKAGENGVKPNDDAWVEETFLSFTLGAPLGTLTEMGIAQQEVGGQTQYYDDLELVQGEGIPIDNAIVDGENIKLSSVYVKRTLGQVGSIARVTYHDPLLSLGPTIETAHRTVTSIAETKFNTTMIQGEIIHTDTQTKEIMIAGIESKLGRTLANYNPVLMEGVVEYIKDNTLYKQPVGYEVSPVFSSFGSLEDKLMVFIKKRQKEYRCGLASVDYTEEDGTPDTPTATSGAIENTFFFTDDAFLQADRAYAVDPSGINDRLILNFQALIKDTTVINKATITVRIRIPVKSEFRREGNQRPQFMIKDFTAGIFRNFTGDVRGLSTGGEVRSTNGQGSEDITGELQSKILELVVTIPDDIPAGVQADYFDVGSVNAHGFRQTDVSVGFALGFQQTQALSFIIIESAEIKFDLDIDQEYNIGVAKIQTVNDHNLVFYPNAGISWLDDDIRNDGISGGGINDEGETIGDAFFITDKIKDIIEAFWVVSGMDLIMNINVTLTDEIPDIEDLRRVMIRQYIQKISELLGTIDFVTYTTDPTNDLPTFNITDAPVNTGQTWTDADFIEPMRQVNYKIDSSKELSTLKLIGKDGIIGTASITSEHTPELGLETVQISRPDIHTARQAAAWLASKKKLYTNAYRYFTCRINYDRANQDYSIADLGKEVGVKNPADGSIVNHVAGGKGRLLIYQMELNRNWSNGYSNYMTFILQQRFFI